MVAVVLGTVVSVGVILFALGVIFQEFHARRAQVLGALLFDPRAFATPQLRSVRRPAALRQVWPAPVRVRARRAA